MTGLVEQWESNVLSSFSDILGSHLYELCADGDRQSFLIDCAAPKL